MNTDAHGYRQTADCLDLQRKDAVVLLPISEPSLSVFICGLFRGAEKSRLRAL